MDINKLIAAGLLKPFKGGRIDDATSLALPFVVENPHKCDIEVCTSQPVSIVMWHDNAKECAFTLRLAPHAVVSLTEIYTSQKYVDVRIEQAEGSECRVTTIMLSGAHTSYETLLQGSHSELKMNAAYVAMGFGHSVLSLTTRHLVSDCKSASIIKGVASGRATGEFRGLVYVAQDAQRTDAQQTNRNIELNGGRIVSEPQLEIYADDVKCSHGSTVGQLDEQAIYYMRQRGISKESAERLLLEGFVEDVVAKCEIDALRDMLNETVQAKLNE